MPDHSRSSSTRLATRNATVLTIPRADIFMGREKRATGRDEVPEIASSLDWLEWLYGDSQIRLRERIIV